MEERRCLGVETKPHLCVLFKPEASILCPTQTSVPSMFSVPGSHLESQLAHKKPPGTYSTPATLTAQWLALGSPVAEIDQEKNAAGDYLLFLLWDSLFCFKTVEI